MYDISVFFVPKLRFFSCPGGGRPAPKAAAGGGGPTALGVPEKAPGDFWLELWRKVEQKAEMNM